MIAVLLGLALLAPLVAPYPFDGMSILKRFKPPSGEHWFGTDEYGRDVLSRTLYGARLSLVMGIGATIISVAVGVPLGLVAGYRRGAVDEWIMRGTDVLMSFPPILLGLLVLASTTPALWKAIVAVGIVYVPGLVRVTRSVTLELAHEEFIQAAQARGEGTGYILAAEILPNAWPPIAVEASLRVTFAILLGAFELSGHGRAAAELGLGAHDRGGPAVHRPRTLDRARPGYRDVRYGGRGQPAGRRSARGPRSAHAAHEERVSEAPLLAIDGLSVTYATRSGVLRAIDGIDLSVESGEALALVGESGSGKSTVALAVMGLLGPEAALRGRVAFRGKDLARRSEERRALRGRDIAIVFQDPFTSLNPSLPMGLQVAEPLVYHRGLSGEAARERAVAALAEVALPDPAGLVSAYPAPALRRHAAARADRDRARVRPRPRRT